MNNFDVTEKKDGDVIKRGWKVRSANKDRELEFYPIFEVKETPLGLEYAGGDRKEVECRYVEIHIPTKGGADEVLRLNFSDLYLFVYTCAEEELRRQLQLRWERQATNIPYEVTFKLSGEEIEQKMAKRLITLTVDEITLAIARAGANKLLKGLGPESTEEYVARKQMKLKAK